MALGEARVSKTSRTRRLIDVRYGLCPAPRGSVYVLRCEYVTHNASF